MTLESGELTGAVGDAITTLPLIIALALVVDISLAHVLLTVAVFQVVWGLWYGLPVSVEPMKALAALAIAGALTAAELAAAGLVLGVILLVIGMTGTLAVLEQWIGEPVIRGVQIAVALLLLETGLSLALEDVAIGIGGLVLVGLVIAVGIARASALVVLLVGLVVAMVTAGSPPPQFPGTPPALELYSGLTWSVADGVVAQFAMTIGNAALATSLLLADRLNADVSPDELSTSMGITNLLAIPGGGIPLCHGCDGVAGKHTFGARTGATNLFAGGLYLAGALVLTAPILAAFPLALLGVLLGVVAASLAWDGLASSNIVLSVSIAILAVLTYLALAFVMGIVAHLVLSRRP